MKLTKALALLMVFAMIAAVFAGCGSNATTAAPAEDTAAEPAEETVEETAEEAAEEAAEPAEEAADDVMTFYLGGVGPLTGAAAIYGNAHNNGSQIAVDEINALDSGIRIEYKFEDDEHDAEKSVNAYNALKDWGLQVLIGPTTTTPAKAVGPETNADRIFMLTPSASSPDVIDGLDNVYQLCFSDTNQGSASAQYIYEQGLGTKVAVIYNNADAYSTGIYNTFAEEAEELGLEIVSVTTFTDDSANDFSVQLNDAKDNGADLIFLPMYYGPASLILTQADSMGYEPVFFGVDGMDGILTVEGFDTALAEGVILLTPFSADAEDERTQAFVAKYQELYGEVPNQFAADGYDCVWAIYEAIQEAGITPDMSNEEICDALIELFNGGFSYDGITGEAMTWDETGAVAKAPKGMVIQNGEYVGM